MYAHYLGIDPGLEGAAVLVSQAGELEAVHKFETIPVGKKRKLDVLSIKTIFSHLPEQTLVMIEDIHAAPGQGVSSMFSMGYNYGVLVALITAVGLPLETVHPKSWKKDMLAGIPKDGNHKDASVVGALRLFPESRPLLITARGRRDHNIADAMLIAEWSRRKSFKQSTH